MAENLIRYKFLLDNLRSDGVDCPCSNPEWRLDEWKKCAGLSSCKGGFECSTLAISAFRRAATRGQIIAEVTVSGNTKKMRHVETWTEMRIERAWWWGKKESLDLAVVIAENVLPIFEKWYPNDSSRKTLVEAAKNYLADSTTENTEVFEKASRITVNSVVPDKIEVATYANDIIESARSAVHDSIRPHPQGRRELRIAECVGTLFKIYEESIQGTIEGLLSSHRWALKTPLDDNFQLVDQSFSVRDAYAMAMKKYDEVRDSIVPDEISTERAKTLEEVEAWVRERMASLEPYSK